MYVWPRTARVALSCIVVVVAGCEGTYPAQPGTPVSVETQSLAEAIEGVAYSEQLTGAGGSGGYSWAVTDGALPVGLTLATGGAISGTPGAPGVADFEVRVTDSEGESATAALSLTVLAPLAVTTTTLPGAVQGRAFGVQLEAAGGDGAYAWSVAAGTLPAGLDLTPAGALLGSPTAAGTSGFTVRVTDGGDQEATRSLALTVEPAPTIQTTWLHGAIPGETYSAQLQAHGGTGGLTWSLTEGALPAGLTLSTAGLISGTPTTTGTASFTVRVVDQGGASDARALSITVAETVALESGVPVTGLSGEAGSARYYVLDVPAGADELVVSITGGTGDADLYVRHDALPLEYTYDCRPLREGNQETCTFTPPDAGPWYVMLRGFSAFTGLTLTATHDG